MILFYPYLFINFQDQLIPNQAWKDYSTANTNYAFEPFENDDKYNSTTSTAPLRERPSTAPLRPSNPPPPRPSSAHKMAPNGQKMPANGQKMAANGHKMAPNGNKMAANGNKMAPKYPPNNSAAQYYHETRSLQRPRGGGGQQYGLVIFLYSSIHTGKASQQIFPSRYVQ